MGLDAGAYLRQLNALLPRGDGLSREPTSVLYKLLTALADELGRFDDRMEQLKREWDPSLTLEMLPDWERVLGLPDVCITEDQTVDQRRDAVVAKLTLLGGQSRAFFISLAASLGYTITITEFDPFVSGGGHSGDPLYDYEWAHTWQVNSAEDTVVYFDCNSVCSEALASWSNEALECAITDRAPAHTVVNFAYGAQYSYLQEGFGSNFTTDFHYFRPVAGAPTVDDFEVVWAFSRSGPGMVRGADGVYGFADENLFSDSQDVEGTGWFLNNTPTITADARFGPDGVQDADLVESTGATNGVYHGAPTLAVGHPYTWWTVIQNDLDADNLKLGSDNTPNDGWVTFNAVTAAITATGAGVIDSGVVDLGDGWSLVWATCFSTGAGMNVVIYSNDASLQRWAVAGIGLRAGYGPVTAHLKNTTALALYKARWNHNVLDSVRRYLCEPSGTYRALWNRDLSNAAWTKTTMTAAKTSTGIDGRANSATRLTATAGNATVLQAMVNGSQTRRFNPFVRRITGAGNIDITLDGGATWTTKAITGAWTRIAIGQTLADPSVGFRIVTNGDAIDVDFCSCQDGDYDMSPVATTTNAIARGGDVASRTYGAEYSTAKGTVVAKILPYTAAYAASQGTILARDTNARHLELDNTPATAGIRDGTNNIITAAISAGALHKVASSFGAVVGSRVTKDGADPTVGAYDGTWGAGVVVQLGHIGGGQQLGGEIEWLIYTPDENINTWLKGHTV